MKAMLFNSVTVRTKSAGVCLALFFACLHGTIVAQTVPAVPPRIALPPATVAPAPPPVLTSTPVRTIDDIRNHAAWRNAITTSRLPKRGCYKISYPKTVWTQIACTRAPRIPYRPHAKGTAYTVGNGPLQDFSALINGATITNAGGVLYTVSQGATESGVSGATGKPLADAYSLQLNTNVFDTPLCSGAKPMPGTPCKGWEQFIYANHGNGSDSPAQPQAQLFIQYWLLGYNTNCPNGWQQQGASCYLNAESGGGGATPVPSLDVAELTNYEVFGAISPSSDSVLFIGYSDAYVASSNDPLAAERGWTEAEFNIFGDGNASQATFNPNTTIQVRTLVNGTTAAHLSCDQNSFTGETNNLTLSGVAQSSTVTDQPSITFTETNGSPTPAGCNSQLGTGLTLELVPGNTFVDWARDTTGFKTYLSPSGAAMCVVHSPDCGTVGHNGKDHFFPKDLPLPAGVKLLHVLYAAYWPPNLSKTDRGGVGSQGSYGVDADKGIQENAPLFTVHWQNACQDSTGTTSWKGLNNTYQVSFVIGVPNGVNVDGAVPLSSASGAMCAQSDQPPAGQVIGQPAGGAIEDLVALNDVVPYTGYVAWAANFPQPGLERTNPNWTFLYIKNYNDFPVFLVNNKHDSSDCFVDGDGAFLGKSGTQGDTTADTTQFLYPGNNQYLGLVVCAQSGGVVPNTITLGIDHTY